MAKKVRTKAETCYGPADTLKTAFYDGLKKWHKKGAKRWEAQANKDSFTFRISQVGECSAKQTREWISGRSEMPVIGMWRTYEGEKMHATVRDFLKEGGIKILEEELEVSQTFNVDGVKIKLVGHLDNIVEIEGKKIIVDIKKANENSFRHMKAEGLPDTYYDQLMGYMACTGIKDSMVFMAGLHGEQTTFEVKFSKKHFEELLARLKDIAQCRANGRIGKREYDYGYPPCTWCEYKQDCWNPDKKKDDAEVVQAKPKYGKDLVSLAKIHNKRSVLEKEITELKSKERKIAIELMERHNAQKTLMDDKTGIYINWVSFDKTSFKVNMQHSPEMVKLGYGKFVTESIEYPRITGGKDI